MFNGLIPLNLPISCTLVHILIGVIAWWIGSPIIPMVFVAYQLTQHLVEGKEFDEWSAIVDIMEFQIGWTAADFLLGHLRVLKIFGDG